MGGRTQHYVALDRTTGLLGNIILPIRQSERRKVFFKESSGWCLYMSVDILNDLLYRRDRGDFDGLVVGHIDYEAGVGYVSTARP